MSFCLYSELIKINLDNVDSTVLVQITGMGEGLVTGGAGEGPISCVCPLVNLQVTRLRESLATLGAVIRFLAVVDSHVSI